MTTADLARSLMTRHHHTVKNRQQAMLGRASAAMGLAPEAAHHSTSIQGKLDSAMRLTYDRSHVTMS